jgi:hypothetical protein
MKTIRERLIGAQSNRSKIVPLSIPSDDGAPFTQEVLIRAPSVGQRNMILGDVDQNGAKLGPKRLSKMQAQAIILCVLDPETLKPIFQPTDEDLILEAPAGGWVDSLFAEVMAIMDDSEAAAKRDFPE